MITFKYCSFSARNPCHTSSVAGAEDWQLPHQDVNRYNQVTLPAPSSYKLHSSPLTKSGLTSSPFAQTGAEKSGEISPTWSCENIGLIKIIEKTKISEKQIERLENEIDQLNASLSDLESFVLPGGTIASSYLHLARTVIRKAERLMVKMDSLEENSVSETALKYINRLSDLLFVAARYANQTDIGGTGDILWRPGQSRED